MEKNKKNLRAMSIVVLALAGLSLLNILFELFFGKLDESLKNATIPEGAPENILLIAKVFILVISFLMLLPQLYIGLKGIKMAKKPDASKGHIIWGIILIVLTAGGLISPIGALLKGGADTFRNIANACSIIVDVAILFEYVVYAKAVRNEA